MSKVWFITGAGSGIGAGAAKAALKADDRVVATGRNMQKVRNALRDFAGESLEVLQVDAPDDCSAYGASKFAVEGLSLAVLEEVEKFEIKITVVEPGFFRTDLLVETNVKWPSTRIDDYAATEVSVHDMWSPFAGTQPGDPGKLGEVLVKLAGMEAPPRLFVAGSDGIAAVAPAVETRLKAVHALEELSNSTNGSF